MTNETERVEALKKRLLTHDCDNRSGGCELLREEAAAAIAELRERLERANAALREIIVEYQSAGGHGADGVDVLYTIARRALATGGDNSGSDSAIERALHEGEDFDATTEPEESACPDCRVKARAKQKPVQWPRFVPGDQS